MTRADRWIGLLLALFSLYVCVESARLGLGTYQRPGPGFLPFWAGVTLGILSPVLVLQGFFRRMEKGQAWQNLGRILLVFLAMLGFTLLVEWLGFILTAFLFIWFLLKVVERRGWGFSIGVALVVTGASHVVFDLWLSAQLPAGLLGN